MTTNVAIRAAAKKGSTVSAIDDIRQQIPPSQFARQLRTDDQCVGTGPSDTLGGL